MVGIGFKKQSKEVNQETILKAALIKDKELAFKAFVNDPLTTAGINDARKLFNEMLKNTK